MNSASVHSTVFCSFIRSFSPSLPLTSYFSVHLLPEPVKTFPCCFYLLQSGTDLGASHDLRNVAFTLSKEERGRGREREREEEGN